MRYLADWLELYLCDIERLLPSTSTNVLLCTWEKATRSSNTTYGE